MKKRSQTKRGGNRLTRISTTLLVLLLAAILALGTLDYIVPSSIGIIRGDTLPSWLSASVTLTVETEEAYPAFAGERAAPASALCTTEMATARLLGVIPIKEVAVHKIADRQVLPGGMLFGVKLYTKGVLVIGLHDIETDNGSVNPAQDAGIRIRDMITKINGSEITTSEEFSKAIDLNKDKKITLEIERDGKKQELTVRPVKTADGFYKTGIFVRDNTSGIGTVTFIDSATGVFCGLGHGICDTDTGVLLPLSKGTLMGVMLNRINPSTAGNPGELGGYFTPDKTGTLIGNTSAGVFGVFTETPPSEQPVSIGLKDEVSCGPAQIYATAEKDGKCRAYDIEIVRLTGENNENKNFIISVTDDTLLRQTGGIVQGMSGSPVIQNGKLVGAVTHVLVNDPTRGYGIFIENMLANMPEVLQ